MKFMLIFTIPSDKAQRDEAIADSRKRAANHRKGPNCWDAGRNSICAKCTYY